LDELGSPLSAPFALAVSGGGDSVALMHLAAGWLKDRSHPLSRGSVLTVDHGLRPGSADDAKAAAEMAARAGFASHVLTWRGPRPRANVEDSARQARYRLLGDWCRAHGVRTIVLAHTRDDQAETFLLRLGRGSGLDGLSAMRRRTPLPLSGYDGIELIRPLLHVGRDELRSYLAERDVGWLEDPMNDDPHFARVRIRQVMPALECAGISRERIAQAARHLDRAREALEADTEGFLGRHACFTEDGSAFVDGAALRAQPREVGLRALSAVLLRVSGRAYRPRFERLEQLYEAILRSGAARTLSGCRIGSARAGDRMFGTATVEVRRERPRGTPIKERRAPGSDGFAAAKSRNLPKKGRIITRLSGS
jgi:tRNA(Ile)-lysidine synthase